MREWEEGVRREGKGMGKGKGEGEGRGREKERRREWGMREGNEDVRRKGDGGKGLGMRDVGRGSRVEIGGNRAEV